MGSIAQPLISGSDRSCNLSPMEKISLTQHWLSWIRRVERELYLLRLEEADIQKMDQTCRRGSPTPSLQLLQSRAGIAAPITARFTALSVQFIWLEGSARRIGSCTSRAKHANMAVSRIAEHHSTAICWLGPSL